MTSEPTRTNEYWNSRPNTLDNEFANYFFKHAGRMHRILQLISNVDFPDRLDVPSDRPIVFASNHRSFLDIAVASAVFEHFELSCRFQVQARMFEQPVVGPWLSGLGCIPTNTETREQAERTSIEALEAGHTIAVMPEGRLVPPGELKGGVGPGRTGVARIVEKTNAWVIPVACHGTGEVWPKGRPVPKLGLFKRRTVAVEFGAPIDFVGDDHQANVDHLMAAISEMIVKRQAT